jgi:hypothetical protein
MNVQAGREAEFEAFVRDVIAPAAERVKPHLADMWQLVRPAKDRPSDATAPTYLFLFYGEDVPYEDWNLSGLLPSAYGKEEGEQRLQEFDHFIGGEQTVYAVEPIE